MHSTDTTILSFLTAVRSRVPSRMIARKTGIALATVNERLTKLTADGLVRPCQSEPGRWQIVTG